MITPQQYNQLLKKYAHEITVQRQMLSDIKNETFKSDEDFNKKINETLNITLYEYLQNLYNEYTGVLWFCFNYDVEQLEKGKIHELIR